MKFPGMIFDMLKMPTASLTTRQVYKGVLIFALILFLMSYGLVAMYPTFRDEMTSEYVGSKELYMDIIDPVGGDYKIMWLPVDDAQTYILLEDDNGYFLSPMEVYNGTDTAKIITGQGPSTFFYRLDVTYQNGSTDMVAQVSTSDQIFLASMYDEFMENPFIKAFVGGGGLSLYTLKGFVAVEFMSWIPLMGVIYLAYVCGSALSREVEDKTLDPVLATPITRTRYVLEKYAAYLGVSLTLTIASFLGLYLGIVSIDESASWLFPGVFSVLPLFIAVQSFAFLASAFFNDPRRAMGISLLFIMVSYIITFGSKISKDIATAEGWSIFTYYNYTQILIDEAFMAWDVIVLIATSVVFLALCLYVFKKKDIPA
ncbi:MAG: ABC transporter permease subunit [Candidatus Thermoplasmatota archaeon]|nr:ABC transporter permease subunit [Candidatus Thermoplasmatota archaeon]